MPFVTSEGLRIHYELAGEGPPLFMHHGTLGSGDVWRIDGFVDALKSDYQLILIDARGHGMSDKPHEPEVYRSPQMAEDIVAVIDELGHDAVHYWGYSLGARVGFALGDQHADRIASFILGGGHPYEADLSLKLDTANLDADLVQTEFLARFGLTPESLPAQYRAPFLANDFLAMNASLGFRPSIESCLSRMTMPCLVYAGDADPVFENARRAAKGLANAKFVALPGLGHANAMAAKDLILPSALNFLRTVS